MVLTIEKDENAPNFVFSQILDKAFFMDLWAKKAVYFPGKKERLNSTFGWNQFNYVLQTSHRASVHPQFIFLVRDGVGVPIETYTDLISDRKVTPFRQISSSKLIELSTKGATLILNGLERFWVPVDSLCRELFSITGERVQANAYYSHQPVPGFKLHFDTHEVFVLQVGGSKLWRIGEISYEHPLSSQPSTNHEPPTGNYDELTLHEGDILYVPRGLWHSAEATDEPSLHISVGVHCRTRLDFAAFLLKKMVGNKELRANLHQPYVSTSVAPIQELLRNVL